jgi:hypothetical protein
MSCEDEVSRVSFIRNLPEVINVDSSDRFIVETVLEGTKTLAFEEFNLNIENALFEEEFLFHTTATNQLCSMMSTGGSILNTSDSIKQSLENEIEQLSSVSTLLLSASTFQVLIDEITGMINPTGQGVIENLSIEERVEIGTSSNIFRSNKYVINEARTEENFLAVTELAPERDWKSGDLNPQSFGLYVEIVDRQIILTPTPKALGKPVDSISIILSGIELYNKQDYIVDIVRVEDSLFDSLVVNGDLNNESLLDVLDYSYKVDKAAGTITINYKHTADTSNDLILTSDPTRSDIFELRVYSVDGEEIVANDTGSSGAGSSFNITASNGEYTLNDISDTGAGYNSGDVIIISGDSIGGSTPDNDLQITITQINAGGSIASTAVAGDSVGSGTFSNISGNNKVQPDLVPTTPTRDIDLFPSACGVGKIAGNIGYKNSIAISDQGDIIAVASRDRPYEISFFRVGSNCSVEELRFVEVNSAVTDISLRKNKLAVGMAGANRVHIFTRNNNDDFYFTKELRYGNRFGTSVYLNSSETHIAVGSRPTDSRYSGTVGNYSVSTGRLSGNQIEEQKTYVSALTGRTGDQLIQDYLNYDKLVYGSSKPANVGYGFGTDVCLAGNTIVIAGGYEGSNYRSLIWSSENNRWEEIINNSSPLNSGYGSSVDISSDGNHMIISSVKENNGDGVVHAYSWNGNNWILKGTYTPVTGSKGSIDQIAISGDGSRVVVGERLAKTDEGTGRLTLFNFPFKGKKVLKAKSNLSQLGSTDISADGQRLVGASPGTGNVVVYSNL